MNQREEASQYPVQWSEGMLLSPHHFQQNDIYWENYIHAKTIMTQRYAWGVSDLRIDEKLLTAGTLSVKGLSALMPDGLVVNGVDLNIDFKDALEKEEKGFLFVHLVVPVRKEGAASLSSSIQRFKSSDGEFVVDDNTGDGQVLVNRLMPIVSLSIDEPHPKFTSFPLFKIEMGQEGAFKLGHFIPPMLTIDALKRVDSLCLQLKLDKLLTKMRKKAKQLSGINSDKDELVGSMVSEQHSRMIKQIVAVLFELEVQCDSGAAHPFEIYKSLAALTGQICSLGNNMVPKQFPVYEHADAYKGFMTALKFTDKIISDISLSYSSVSFSEQEDGTFSLEVDKTWLSRELFIELGFRKGDTKEGVLDWMGKARVGSSSVLRILTDRRMPGAERERIERQDELNLVEKPNSVLFSLKNSTIENKDKKMELIKPGQKLYIKGDANADSPLTVTLHIANAVNKNFDQEMSTEEI